MHVIDKTISFCDKCDQIIRYSTFIPIAAIEGLQMF